MRTCWWLFFVRERTCFSEKISTNRTRCLYTEKTKSIAKQFCPLWERFSRCQNISNGKLIPLRSYPVFTRVSRTTTGVLILLVTKCLLYAFTSREWCDVYRSCHLLISNTDFIYSTGKENGRAKLKPSKHSARLETSRFESSERIYEVLAIQAWRNVKESFE